ncbi:hypothetical protein [Bradyrhizobium sp. DASA03120]|uniref:hypothetical protein n=1 Tax=Bradyrhizobium sp. SMVTL-02 TaxID=3395917 RepID=UPI003F706C64
MSIKPFELSPSQQLAAVSHVGLATAWCPGNPLLAAFHQKCLLLLESARVPAAIKEQFVLSSNVPSEPMREGRARTAQQSEPIASATRKGRLFGYKQTVDRDAPKAH